MSKRVSIYSTNKSYEAEMLKGHLANNGIVAFIINKKDSSYLFGDIELMVHGDDVIKAKHLLEDYLSNE